MLKNLFSSFLFIAALISSNPVDCACRRFTKVGPPGLLNHAPLVITNQTGLSADRLYVIAKGQMIVGADAYFLQPNLTTGICTLVSPNLFNSADPSISVQLSSLPSLAPNQYYLYIPQVVSGRLYISVDHPLNMETIVGPPAQINDPSQTTVQDPNYYTLYQDFEFTLDINYDLYANVTNVDYFSLPMTLGSYTYPSGNLYPTLDGLTVVGYPTTSTRSAILNNINTFLSANDHSSTPQWSNLSIPFYNNPYVVGPVVTDLRILAAKLDIALGQNATQFVGGANAQNFFSPNYLQNTVTGPSAGLSYMDQLYNSIASTPFSMETYPASQPASIYNVTAGGPNVLVLTQTSGTGPTPIDINLNNLSTESLLSGDIGTWVSEGAITANNAWTTEIAKMFSALFTAGFLPPPLTIAQPIQDVDTYFSPYRSLYFSNPSGFTLYGPWYNLYDQAIHPLLIQTGGFGLGYAYDFDDLLGLAGLLHVNIQTGAVLNPAQPYYVLTLGPINTPIPNAETPFGPYTLNVGPLAGGSQPIDIIYSTNPSMAPSIVAHVTGSPQTITGVYNYFQVKYYNVDVQPLIYNVYPQYQTVQTTTTRYNATDVALMNGIVFLAGTDGTNININTPFTPP